MSALDLFSYDGHDVRVLVEDGEPWWVASDVARILGYRMASDMTRRLDDEDRGTRSVRTPSGDQEMTVISEPGLYVAVLGSQVPGARAFKRWVTHDVLPSIRRTGGYVVQSAMPAVPATFADALQLAADQARQIERQKTAIAVLEPRAAVATALIEAEGDYAVRQVAHILQRDHGIKGIGEKRLFSRLRDWKWLDRKNRPYQRHIEAGRIRTRVTTYEHPRTGERILTDPQVRITGKGLADIHRLIVSGGTAELDVL